MIVATYADRQRILEILTKAFQSNPGINALIGNYNKTYRIRKILEYSVDYAIRRKGIYLSDDYNAVALCYRFNKYKESLIDCWSKIKLIFNAISFFKINKLLFHISFIKKIKPAKKDILYFWYLGANNQAAKTNSTNQLINDLLKMAQEKGLDIYAETTLLRNRIIYERFGFKTFKDWHNRDLNLRVWFLKKEFQSK